MKKNLKLVRLIVLGVIFNLFVLSELQAAIIYVDVNASGSNNGSSWSNAYVDLQDALDNSAAGDEIRVA